MTRYRICKLCGDMHDVAAWPDNHRDLPPQRSLLPAPMLISDALADLTNPMDMRKYDSKSEFRKTTKRLGGVELGNDSYGAKPELDKVHISDVGEAIRKVNAGYKPMPAEATAAETVAAL